MGKVPYDIKVTNNKGTLQDFIHSFNFIVILNGFTYGFEQVINVETSGHYETYQEGGNEHAVFARKTNYDQLYTMIFRRGMPIKKSETATSAAMAAAAIIPNNLARKSALLSVASMDPFVSLEVGPAVGLLQIFDRQYKNDVATFSFFSYGASDWKMGDLDATSGNILYEDITIVHSGLKRLAQTTTPTFLETFSNFDDSYNSETLDEINLEDKKKEAKSKKDDRDKEEIAQDERIKRFADERNKIVS
ncbi:MAG: hypothetical protein FWC41_05540 [Firmicutes bacterium]|nr:hypothetical protein [Bacillota bacterium]